jgi:hypothetical protein
MTREDLFRGSSQEMAKELAVACSLLDQWNLQSQQPPAPGIPAADFPDEPTPSLRYNIDRAVAQFSSVTVEGWAFDPSRGNPPGASFSLFVRVPSGGWMAYPAASVVRPDVAVHYPQEAVRLEGLDRSGFSVVLPAEGIVNSATEIMIVQQAHNGFWGRTGPIRQTIGTEAAME